MEIMWDKLIKVLAAVGGAVAGLFGGWDALLSVLLTMMAIDYISGIVVALMGRSDKSETGYLSSSVGFKGLGKKVLMLMLVAMGAMIDRAMGSSAMVRNAVCWFYIANEGLSFLENLTKAGVPFPAAVQRVLGMQRDKADGGDLDAYPEDDEPPDDEPEDDLPY